MNEGKNGKLIHSKKESGGFPDFKSTDTPYFNEIKNFATAK